MEIRSKVVAIDGPSGSGKSTIAKLVADKLSLTYLDTGAMVRAIALSIHNAKISFEDTEGMQSFLNEINFEYGVDENILIRINGEDLTAKIREHNVSHLASQVSKYDFIRTFLKDQQRTIAGRCPGTGTR